LISNDDYPPEALRNGEEGVVDFRLDIGTDGRATNCTVTKSSGSASLDSTTCRLMRERAQLTPARDSKGEAVTDQLTARIVWSIADDPGLMAYSAAILVERVSLNPRGEARCTLVADEQPESEVPCAPEAAGLLGRAVEKTFVTTFTPEGEAERTDAKDHGTIFAESSAVTSIAADGSIIACQTKRGELAGTPLGRSGPRGLCELFEGAKSVVFEPIAPSAPRILIIKYRGYAKN
jgi:TonB family protein